MKTDQLARGVQQSGIVIDTAKYHIDPKNIVQVTQILRNMYSRPDLAIFREYISNALDAHQHAKATDQIEVHVPTFAEAWFSVRDFGGGLDVESTKALLYGYGSSGAHKRASNEQIGGFGIGCKSAFSVCDAFTYTVWHGDMKRVWNCYLDEHDMGCADLQFESPSDERAGVEVHIPVRCAYQEGPKFLSLLDEVYAFMDAKLHPRVLNAPAEYKIVETPPVVLSTTISGNIGGEQKSIQLQIVNKAQFPSTLDSLRRQPTLILGGTAYSIDMDRLGFDVPYKDEDDRETREMWDSLLHNSVIRAPIGFVQPAPSREEIQYSGATKKILQAVYTALLSDTVLKELETQITSDTSTYRERVTKHQLAKLPAATNKWFNIQGFKVPAGEGVFHGHVNMTRNSYESNWRTYSVTKSDPIGAKSPYYPIKCSPGETESVIVLLGEKDGRGEESLKEYARRALTKYKEDHPDYKDNLYVEFFESLDNTGIPWLVDKSVDCYESVADLPVVKSEFFYVQGYNGRRRGHISTAGPKVNYVQSARKFVKLGDKVSETRSQCWEACMAKDVKGGIYIPIDKFVMQGPRGDMDQNELIRRMQEMFTETGNQRTIRAVETLLPRASVLLGVRKKYTAEIAADAEFKSIWDYIHERFTEDMEDNLIDPEGLLYGLYRSCYTDTNSSVRDNAASNWFVFANRIAACQATTDTKLGKRVAWWHTAGKKCTGRTEEWAGFLSGLTMAIHGVQSSGEAGLQELLQTKDTKTKRPLVDWSLLSGGEWKFFQDVAEKDDANSWSNNQWLKIKEATNGKQTSRMSKDMVYLFEHCPEAAMLLGLDDLVAGINVGDGYVMIQDKEACPSAFWSEITPEKLGVKLLKRDGFLEFLAAAA